MNLSKHTTAALRSELSRLEASTAPAGPVLGEKWVNHAFAIKQIRPELAKRQAAEAALAAKAAAAKPAPPPVALAAMERREAQQAPTAKFGMPESAVSADGLCRAAFYPPRHRGN